MAAMASVGAKDVKQSTEPPSLNQIQRWDVIVRPLAGPIGRPSSSSRLVESYIERLRLCATR